MSKYLPVFRSLRVRITFAMLALAAVGSSIFAIGIYVGAERLEQTVLNSHVRAEFDSLAREVRRDPGIDTMRSALLLAFVGRDNPALPAEFAGLAAGGYHDVHVGDKAYQVYVGDVEGRRIYVGYDITEWESLEEPVINTLFVGVILSSILAIALGIWISSQIIAPVTALSDRVRSLDPRVRDVRIAQDFSGVEVSAIAEAFDRFMQRLDGFVEREQLFTSAAAHELRTPLAVIQGATDILGAQTELPPAAQRATARLERATRDMREYIDALMFLSREESPERFAHATSDIGEIVERLAGEFRPLAESGAVSVSVTHVDCLNLEVPAALPAIVISNLLRNALENTQSGEIRIELSRGVLRIVDTGRGIDADALARLFDREFTTKQHGGLGLHLSKRICDRCGWHLDVSSEAGAGTTVSVDFTQTKLAL